MNRESASSMRYSASSIGERGHKGKLGEAANSADRADGTGHFAPGPPLIGISVRRHRACEVRRR